MDGQDALKIWRWATRLVTALNVGLLALWAAVYLVPLPDRSAGWSCVVEYRDGRPAYVFLAPDDKWRLPVDRIDPAYVKALVALEDKRFWSHHGVDPLAIVRAGRRRRSEEHTSELQSH